MKHFTLKITFRVILLTILPYFSTISLIYGQIQKNPTYHVNLPIKSTGNCKASCFATSVTYVPLETKTNCLVGMISKIDLNESVIAISDSKKILLFNWQGKFLRQIGRTGKGPGEYILVMDFLLKGNDIYITSTGKTAIIKYSIDGKFLG